jgi:hypothetical protein
MTELNPAPIRRVKEITKPKHRKVRTDRFAVLIYEN